MEKALSIIYLLLPLFSFITLFENNRYKKHSGSVACLLSLLSFAISVKLLSFGSDSLVSLRWIETHGHQFNFTIRLDKTAKIMSCLVSFVALAVNMYSTKYMQGEKHYHKYFAYIGLFTFSMLGIVLSDNLLFIYIFWELVGLSSYLLIGFWYQNPQATMASKKAFIINRIGDIGFLVGIMLLWSKYGSLELKTIMSFPIEWNHMDTAIGLCLFGGCVGKSAQFPLQVWLPDAMHGPTPASALIHAATMVAAGIYFMIKVSPFCSKEALEIMGAIGSITALLASLTAGFQFDIKKILAYSTISQLGYMVVALSSGVPESALLHLFTHAFFKAGLFLCAGAIIHEIDHQNIKIAGKRLDPQDIRFMGGIRKYMPKTFWVYFICYLSAIGAPFTSGFLSKDFIINCLLLKTLETHSPIYYLILIFTLSAVIATSYYMTRQLLWVFMGEYRASKDTYRFHETPWLMLLPIILLTLFGLFFGIASHPFDASKSYILEYLNSINDWVPFHKYHLIALSISILLTAIGISLAIVNNKESQRLTQTQIEDGGMPYFISNHFLINKFYIRTILPINLLVSKYFHKFDTKVIDYAIDKFGISNVIAAHSIKIFDQYVVDNVFSFLSWLAKFMGDFFLKYQNRKIQDYLLQTFIWASLLIILIWYFA